jgi:pimeloyl-ACP methyl ester carboxylesterase
MKKLLSNEYPFTSDTIKINGNNMHYVDEGDGEVIVMLHGNPDWSFYYRHLIKQLSAHYRVIAPDYIGCGLSDKPTVKEYPYTLERRIEDITTFISKMGIDKPFTLMVHDWGGPIGFGYAVQHPDTIKKLIVCNTSIFPLREDAHLPGAIRFARTKLGEWLILKFNLYVHMANQVCCKRKPLSHELRHDYAAPYDSPANRVAILQFVREIPTQPTGSSYITLNLIRDKLSVLKNKPILFLWGNADVVFGAKILQLWKGRFPLAEVHEFADCGHYVCEDAADLIEPIVKKFIEKGEQTTYAQYLK